MLEAVPWENPTGISGNVAYGGTNPPRNRKGGAGNPPPKGARASADKILQRAVLMVLEPVYEQDFLDCSYGSGRGAALTKRCSPLWEGLMEVQVAG